MGYFDRYHQHPVPDRNGFQVGHSKKNGHGCSLLSYVYINISYASSVLLQQRESCLDGANVLLRTDSKVDFENIRL